MLQQKELQQQFDGTCSRRCSRVQTAVSIERNTCVHVDQVFVSDPSHITGSASERQEELLLQAKTDSCKKSELSHQQKIELGHFKLFILCSVSGEELQNISQPSYINVLFVIMML